MTLLEVRGAGLTADRKPPDPPTHTVLDWDGLPMRLYRRWARFGTWSPWQFDLEQDRRDWEAMAQGDRDGIAALTAQFLAGEQAVALDVLPLADAMQETGPSEEVLYLSTFISDEAKHSTFFRRYFDEAVPAKPPAPALTPSYRRVFFEALPEAMTALTESPSPDDLVRAAATYNLFVEGVLAETGYWTYTRTLEADDLLPGLREALVHIQRDESRHIAYGVYLLSRLVADDPGLWDVVAGTLDDLFDHVPGIVEETARFYRDAGSGPRPSDVIEYASGQLQGRLAHVERARDRSPTEVDDVAADLLEDPPSGS